jgi:hypothetical protein
MINVLGCPCATSDHQKPTDSPCGKVNRLRPLPAEGPRETGLVRLYLCHMAKYSISMIN